MEQVSQANDLQAGNPEGEPAAALADSQASEPVFSQRGEGDDATEGPGASQPDILVVEPPAPAGAASTSQTAVEGEQQSDSEQQGGGQLTQEEASGEQEQGGLEETAAAKVADKLAALELGSGSGGALATPGDKVASHAAAGSSSSSSRGEGEGRDDRIKAHVPPALAAAPSSATLASGSSSTSRGSTASRRTFSAPPKCLQGRVSA